MVEKIRVGVSSCLLGNPVRYDGGHKHNHYVAETLGEYFSFIPVCPEVECGLSVPRESMRLVQNGEAIHLITRSGEDHTKQMLSYCESRVQSLAEEALCGFIFKSDSPSSGLYRVKVYHPSGQSLKQGRGFFASAFVEQYPRIPVEEEGRLNDSRLRENFLEKVFGYRRWKDFMAGEPSLGKLVTFHMKEKFLLLSHSPKHYTTLGKLVAQGKAIPNDRLYDQYERLYMEALSLLTTTKKNINVMQHLMGYFKNDLTSDEKKELLGVLEDYANRLVPLVVPLTLIKHYVRKFDVLYLKDQIYLNPHPAALMLRNHV